MDASTGESVNTGNRNVSGKQLLNESAEPEEEKKEKPTKKTKDDGETPPSLHNFDGLADVCGTTAYIDEVKRLDGTYEKEDAEKKKTRKIDVVSCI